MAECKASSSFLVWLHFKSKVGGQEEVTTETDNIADGIGNRFIHIVYQQQIDGILNGDGYTTNNPEPNELYKFLFLNHFQSDPSSD